MTKGIIKNLMFLVGCVHILGLSAADARIDVSLLNNQENIVPIVVIGSGPAGLMAAVYGARAGFKTLVIEGEKPGGLLTETTEVENWPGVLSGQGPDLIRGTREQAEHFGVEFLEGSVIKIEADSWPFRIHIEDGPVLNALSIVIASGASPRKLGVPGEEDHWGAGVSSCAVCDAPFYKGESVIVIGGGDSAAEEAMQLARHASQVKIIVRKDHMRASAHMQKLLKGYPNISILYNHEIKEIQGDSTGVTQVRAYNNQVDETFTMPIDGVFLAIGHIPNSGFIKDIVVCDAAGYIQMEGRTQYTSRRGIFAAGDVQDHRYRQAGTAAGHGIAAGLDAEGFLRDIGFSMRLAQQLPIRLFEVDMDPEIAAELEN